jgi:hypothetical protein
LTATTATLASVSDRATASITVANGPRAGTYLLYNADVPCEITDQLAPLPKHQFSVTLGASTPSSDPKMLTLLTVIVPNADLRGPNHAFFAAISFGELRDGATHWADTRPGERLGGSGTVTITASRHGEDATVQFDVKSADDIALSGVIQCSGITRY